jgi:hypothetical protein
MAKVVHTARLHVVCDPKNNSMQIESISVSRFTAGSAVLAFLGEIEERIGEVAFEKMKIRVIKRPENPSPFLGTMTHVVISQQITLAKATLH